MSNDNQSKNSGQKRNQRRRRRPASGQKKGQQNPNRKNAKSSNRNEQRQEGQSGQARNRKPNQGRNRNQARRNRQSQQRRRKPINTREVVSAYLETLARYIKARKDYFESFRGVFNKRVRRTFDGYQNNLRKLRKFEETLKPWQREELQKTIHFFPEDNEFSSNHPEAELAPESVEPKPDNFYFHDLISQRERPRYAEDTEESEGTREDYEKYKEELTLVQ